MRQADAPKLRSWEVAGTSHVDQDLRASREAVELRDNGVSLEANLSPLCAVPLIGTRVPTHYVVASAVDKLAAWAAGGPPPPTVPRLTMTQIRQRPQQSVVARDKDGLAEGGIRLAALAVPRSSMLVSASPPVQIANQRAKRSALAPVPVGVIRPT